MPRNADQNLTPRRTGMELCAEWYRFEVAPALHGRFPALPHGAALMGRGSEVLGFDDEMSTDHDWSARVTVFLADPDLVEVVQGHLDAVLPDSWGGAVASAQVTTPSNYLQAELDLDLDADWDAFDWLSLPEQRLCAMTAGGVFHDEVGLTGSWARLAYYPRDVWLYLLSAAWWRVHPEINLVGRTAQVGDDLGSALITGQIVDDLIHLAFLISRRYAPYRKWRGTAFARLPIAETLQPHLAAAVGATDVQQRQEQLGEAYRVLIDACNDLGLTAPVETDDVRLWGRPFSVPWADFPGSLMAIVDDPTVLTLAQRWRPPSGVDQVRDLLWTPRSRQVVRALLAE